MDSVALGGKPLVLDRNVNATTISAIEIKSPSPYQQLARVDRAHAESLVRSCHLKATAVETSRLLANRSLFQTVVTSIPFIASDFFVLWFLLYGTTAVIERAFGLSTFLVTR